MYAHDETHELISLKNLEETMQVLQIEITDFDYIVMKLFESSKDLDNLPFYEIFQRYLPDFEFEVHNEISVSNIQHPDDS